MEFPDLSTGARLVYLALDDYARSSDGCRPHQSTLAQKLGLSERTVKRHIAELRAAGILTSKRRKHEKGRRGNEYDLIVRATGQRRDSDGTATGQKCPLESDKNVPSLPTPILIALNLKTETEKKEPPCPPSSGEKHAFSPDQSMLSQEIEVFGQREEIGAAFDLHLKYRNGEGRDTVLLTAMALARQGKFDWDKLRGRHAGYAAYWDRQGWNFCPLSFLGWIRAGMPPAPREIAFGSNAPRESATERAIRVGYERIAKDGHL